MQRLMVHRPERMKILYLMDGVDRMGGTERQLVELFSHLDRDRIEPHVAFFQATPHMLPVASLARSASVFNIPRLLHPAAPIKLLKVSSFVRAGRFQLVHVLLNAASLAAPFFCRLGGAQVVASRRDMGFWHTTRQLAVLRASNRFVTRIIANSDAVRQNVHRIEGYPLAKIEVVYNGHNPARFDVAPLDGFRERFHIGATDPIIGMVANFSPWKRHLDLLQAFVLVRQQHPRTHLVLIGGGSAESTLKEATRSLGLESVVHFLSGVADVIPTVKHLSVGVLCSDSEGLSNAVLEYMGCGKPTVCTNAGGNGELIKDGETGFLVAPGDVGSLAERIGVLLARPSFGELIGDRARRAVAGLTSRRMAERHMDLYERLAGSQRAQSRDALVLQP